MPAKYPYLITDRLTAQYLNWDLELNPSFVPPQSAHGGAHRFKQWIDTSVYPAMLRMCTVEVASPAYIANQWMTMAAIHWGDPVPYITWGPEGGYLPLTGGAISGYLTVGVDLYVYRDTGVHGSLGVNGNIGCDNLISANDIHTNWQTTTYDHVINRNLLVYGSINCQSSIAIAGTYIGTGLSITGEGYISGGLTLGQSLAVGNQISSYSIVTSYQTIYGNLAVNGQINCPTYYAVNMAASGNITSLTLNTTNMAAAGNISCTYDISAGRTVFATGVDIQNIVVRSPANEAIYVPSGGITALHGLFGNRLQVGSGDEYALWVPFGSATVRVLRFTGPSGLDDQNFYMYSGAGVKILNYSTNHYWAWNMSSGDLTYVGDAQEFFQLQNGSKYLVNKIGPMQAWNYLYLSDRRSKTNIVPSEYGLDAVLALQPVKFNRHRKSVEEDYPPAEIGFVAQEVAEVIPEAVKPSMVEFPDGSGGPDSDAPALSLTIMPILGAMVQAFKQLDARLAALEGAK